MRYEHLDGERLNNELRHAQPHSKVMVTIVSDYSCNHARNHCSVLSWKGNHTSPTLYNEEREFRKREVSAGSEPEINLICIQAIL